MKKSFTLIEIIISIIIISLMANFGLAYYNQYSQQTTLKSEAYILKSDLELIKKKSISSDKPGSCVNFQGYQINLYSNFYDLGFICSNTFQKIKTKLLPYNINILNNESILFKPIKIDFSTQKIIYIKNNQLNPTKNCLIINITKNGIIILNDAFKSC